MIPLLIVCYLLLALLAPVCAVQDHPGATEPSHEHHGAHSPSMHSSLCAWACQANASASSISVVAASVLMLVGVSVFACSGSNQVLILSTDLRPRAPPLC